MGGPSSDRGLVNSPAPRIFIHRGSDYPTGRLDPSDIYSSTVDRQCRTSLVLQTLRSRGSVSVPLAKWKHLRDAKYTQSNCPLSRRTGE